MGKKSIVIVLVIVCLALAATFFVLRQPQAHGRADYTDAKLVAQGAQLYAQHCASCHGPNLEGQPNWQTRKPNGALPAPPQNETGHTWHHSDQQLFDMTKFGVTPYSPPGWVSEMPAFEGVLSDDQIWAVLAYIKSRWPERVREAQQQRSAGKH